MNTAFSVHFEQQYQLHLKHLKLKGLQPKTIDAYARAIRRLGRYFSGQIDALSEAPRLLDIVTVEEAQRLFSATLTLSYRVFYFTVYSLGPRLGEGLALKVGDVDAARMRVQIAISC